MEISFTEQMPSAEQAVRLGKLIGKDTLSQESLDDLARALGWIAASVRQHTTWPTAKTVKALTKNLQADARTLSHTLAMLFESEEAAASAVRHQLEREFQKLAVRHGRVQDLIGEMDRLHHAASKVAESILSPTMGGVDKQYGDMAYLLGVLADIFHRETGSPPTAYNKEVTGTIEGTFMPFALPAIKLIAPGLARPSKDAQLAALAKKVLTKKRAESRAKSKGRK